MTKNFNKIIILVAVFSLSILLANCGQKSPGEMLKAADKSVENKNVPEAVQTYEKIMKEYPDSEEAADALFRIAALYQGKMIKNYSEKESLNKAVELFKQVYIKYPKSKIAPKGLFMSGFVEANDLNNFQEATKTYKLFLEKYPNSELSVSAKEELQNMGLSPEEILMKKKNVN